MKGFYGIFSIDFVQIDVPKIVNMEHVFNIASIEPYPRFEGLWEANGKILNIFLGMLLENLMCCSLFNPYAHVK